MLKKFKFDVSISVAEEDLPIAQKIVQSLKSRKITYYFYHEQGAQNWGEHILKISLARYGAEARFVLVIISKTYTERLILSSTMIRPEK